MVAELVSGLCVTFTFVTAGMEVLKTARLLALAFAVGEIPRAKPLLPSP